MTVCCATNCHNRSGNSQALFAVPRAKCAAQVRRRLQWLLHMSREKLPPKKTRLCEDHFTLDQFEEDSLAGRKRLKAAAVPSIFCGVTGAQQPVDSSQHSLPASQATVILAKSDRVLDLERGLDLEQKRRRKAKRERDRLRESLGRVFSSDQINVLEKGTMRGKSWSPASLRKALHVKVARGSKGYEFVRENIALLPATRTLQIHIEHIKFKPGEVKNCLFDVIKHSEAVGITVSAVVTDMGLGNMAIW
ncbi:hypothetical protein HPB51_007075 [Rhipicephalus microplus]|uniref:THAP-type domain-containing protein n=1 Tax=Rhipicephalus microplus TaxID=6941 RepID=A0A9J6DZV4_RHIMP|nr:hypothetical protein HPB51_007075 [Rhipicephalus microplus]